MLKLYNEFPRQVCIGGGRRTIYSMEEMLKLVNKYIRGYKRIFVTVYNYTPDTKKEIALDKLFFDFDNKQSCLQDVQAMHHWLKKLDYRHIMFFSGGGFHIYVMTKNFEKIDKDEGALKNCLRNSQEHIIIQSGLEIKKNVDEHIIGDIARVATMPETWNVKRRRYCICIDEKDLDKGYDFIREKAVHKRFKYFWYGKNLFDVNEFNKNVPKEIGAIELTDFEVKIITADNNLISYPKCIQRILVSEHAGWRGRFLAIIYFREKGYTKRQTYNILKKYLDKKELHHCVKDEKQLDYLYLPTSKNNVYFPRCSVIKNEGKCPIIGICGKGEKELYK